MTVTRLTRISGYLGEITTILSKQSDLGQGIHGLLNLEMLGHAITVGMAVAPT
jgi:hypothetical protein